MRWLTRLLLGVALAGYALSQVRKPGRWFGWFFARAMNRTHSRLTDWGLEHIQVGKDFVALDVGCGGGRTIEKLAAMAREVHGIDNAIGSVSTSRAHNARLIREGRVTIKQASVSALPFPDNHFDLVTAVETQYYWPDLLHDMREILRVLKPGGTLLIIAETYKGGRADKYQRPIMALLNCAHLSPDDQRNLFQAAGYSNVQVFEEKQKGWICVIGRKGSHG
jgi:ubiquinone/menaquinone biosynthesis C-methylase UbiE